MRDHLPRHSTMKSKCESIICIVQRDCSKRRSKRTEEEEEKDKEEEKEEVEIRVKASYAKDDCSSAYSMRCK